MMIGRGPVQRMFLLSSVDSIFRTDLHDPGLFSPSEGLVVFYFIISSPSSHMSSISPLTSLMHLMQGKAEPRHTAEANTRQNLPLSAFDKVSEFYRMVS